MKTKKAELTGEQQHIICTMHAVIDTLTYELVYCDDHDRAIKTSLAANEAPESIALAEAVISFDVRNVRAALAKLLRARAADLEAANMEN